MSISMQRGVLHNHYERLPDEDGGTAPKPNAPMTKMELLAKAWKTVWPKNDISMRIRFVFSIALLVIGKILDLAPPFALKLIIDSLTRPTGPEFPIAGLVFFGLARFLSAAIGEIRNIIYATVSANAERAVALEVMEHLMKLSFRFHVNRKTGSILRSVSRGASSFGDVMRTFLFNLLPVVLQVVAVCILLFSRYDWWFAMITFLTIAVYFVYTILTTKWRDGHRRNLTEKDNQYNQRATDALLNYETVKYFNAEEHEKNRYDLSLQEFRSASIISQQSLSILNIGQNFIISFGVVLAMVLAAGQVLRGGQSVGDFVMIQQFILTLYTPLGFLGTYWRMINQSLVDVESLLKLLDEPIEIRDLPLARPLEPKRGHLVFKNVSFGYAPNRPILNNISFEVKPGQRVAIVGASGAGKSTLCRLIFRFYDVLGGEILIDGQNIAHVQQNSLRKFIGIVPQDCVLFNDTLAYNIGYGIKSKQLADATQEQIEQAAKAASIHDFIMRQPEGYQTLCGERGVRLSGGERQRVAIARAILKDPMLMLYDEATSSLDTVTEQAIQKSLDEIAEGRSVLIVAHRLSTIVNSDNIIVLKEGSIVEQGSHEQLLKLDGMYADMWRRQQHKAELEHTLAELGSS